MDEVQREYKRLKTIPVTAKFFAPFQTASATHTASYTMSTRSLSRGKATGRGVNHPPPFSAEFTERVELYLYSTSESSWPVLGRNLPFTFYAS